MGENKKPMIRFKGFHDAWEQRKLGEITDSYSGGTPSVGNKEYYGGDIPFIRSGEINLESTELFITEKALQNSSAKLVKEDDILYALYGATSGEVGISRINGAINQAILAIKPKNNFNTYFILQWLRREKNNIVNTYLQGGQGNLSGNIVKELMLDIPLNQDEQSKIGELFKNLDNLITLHQRKYDKLQNVKKSMLEKMFPTNGSNVPEIRFAGFHDAWEQRKLGEVSPLRGGFAFQSELFINSGVPVVKISNILSNGGVGGKFDHYDELMQDENYILPDKAAIIAMSGATTGKVSILENPNKIKVYQNQRVGYFTDTGLIDYTFISTVVRSELFANRLKSVLVAGAQPNVSSKEIDTFEFYMPSEIEEQIKIGTFFKQLDNLITLHQRKLEKLQNIKKSCLERMFV
jgi:type I restriction enzyme S subunit